MSYKYKCVCKHTSSGMKPRNLVERKPRKMMEQTTKNDRAPTTKSVGAPTTPQELEDTFFLWEE